MGSAKLEIAISGAGIAGLTAAIALLKHPLINVHIYEQATELKEIGASIALGPNGLRTLERLGLEHAISDEVCFRGTSNIPMIYRHWKTNEVLSQDFHENVPEYLHHTARYHRAHLQEALLQNVPKEIIHLRKRFKDVSLNDERVQISFEDGSVATADILLGADGLRSGVRSFLVPELELKWSGWTAFRAIFDFSLVRNIPDLPPDSIHWIGPQTNFFASRLGKNKFTTVGGYSSDPDGENPPFNDVVWDQEASVKYLREIYKDWNPVVKALAEATPEIRYYPNFSIAGPLKSWVFGNHITLIGDAAHAHGGAFATGGSIAIDDAYAFSLALNHVFPPSAITKPSSTEIGKALRLYEATRKPHAEKLLNIVHNANKKKAANVGKEVTDEDLRSLAVNRPDTVWLHEHDVIEAFEEVVHRDESGKDTISARL